MDNLSEHVFIDFARSHSAFSRVLVSVLCSSPVLSLSDSFSNIIHLYYKAHTTPTATWMLHKNSMPSSHTHTLHKLPAICSKTYLFTQQNHFHSLTHHFVVVIVVFFNFTLFCATLTICKTNINASLEHSFLCPFYTHTQIQCAPCGNLVGVFVLFAYGLFSF